MVTPFLAVDPCSPLPRWPFAGTSLRPEATIEYGKPLAGRFNLRKPFFYLVSPQGPVRVSFSRKGVMRVTSSAVVLGIGLAVLSGCSELRARSHAREGNRHFREGNYEAARHEYETAEELYPGLPVVVFNKGLACRQLMIPGARTKANAEAADCALAAFQRLQEIAPEDPRGEQLYTQTLFDADRFDELVKRYEAALQKNPADLAAINGLTQVYSRWNRWRDELRWTAKRADLTPKDAQAQYGVGVFIWNILFQYGGHGAQATYDPRPDPNAEQEDGEKNLKVPPPFAEGDIVGEERVRLADQGIEYLKRALAVRPQYRDAMTYINLLYRQKSFAFFDNPEEWQRLVDEAESWRKKAIQTAASTPPEAKK